MLVSLSACEIQSPDYTADVLLPLFKTTIKPEDVTELAEVTFRRTITIDEASDAVPNQVSLPPISSGATIGPLPLEDTDNTFYRARVDTVDYQITVTNNFPINMKAGTTIKITNSSNTDVIVNHVLPNDLEARGGTAVINIRLNSTTPYIDNDLLLYLENFASDGGNNLDFATYNNIDLEFKVNLVRINDVELYQGKSYSLQDTVDFQMEDQGNVGNLGEGTLTLFVKNGWPANYNFQAYFLDGNYQIVDSLLLNTSLSAPEVTDQGFVVLSSVNEQKLVTTLSRDKLNMLRNSARYLSFKGRFKVVEGSPLTPAQFVHLRHENQVGLQLIGDLKLEVN